MYINFLLDETCMRFNFYLISSKVHMKNASNFTIKYLNNGIIQILEKN